MLGPWFSGEEPMAGNYETRRSTSDDDPAPAADAGCWFLVPESEIRRLGGHRRGSPFSAKPGRRPVVLSEPIADDDTVLFPRSTQPGYWREATRDHDLASEMVRRLESLMESAPHVYGAFSPDGPAEAPPLRMPPRIPGARDLTLYAERRLITAPFLWVDSDQLLKQADDAQDDDCFEVFVLAPSVDLAR